MTDNERIRELREKYDMGLCDAKREVQREVLIERIAKVHADATVRQLLSDILRFAVPSSIGNP